MYNEEKIINGVLCWRGMPDDDWTPYTAEKLTERLAAVKAQRDEAVLAACVAMKEKIARCIDMSCRKSDMEIAAHIRHNIHPLSADEVDEYTALYLW